VLKEFVTLTGVESSMEGLDILAIIYVHFVKHFHSHNFLHSINFRFIGFNTIVSARKLEVRILNQAIHNYQMPEPALIHQTFYAGRQPVEK
jgi:hypothetical protein